MNQALCAALCACVVMLAVLAAIAGQQRKDIELLQERVTRLELNLPPAYPFQPTPPPMFPWGMKAEE